MPYVRRHSFVKCLNSSSSPFYCRLINKTNKKAESLHWTWQHSWGENGGKHDVIPTITGTLHCCRPLVWLLLSVEKWARRIVYCALFMLLFTLISETFGLQPFFVWYNWITEWTMKWMNEWMNESVNEFKNKKKQTKKYART